MSKAKMGEGDMPSLKELKKKYREQEREFMAAMDRVIAAEAALTPEQLREFGRRLDEVLEDEEKEKAMTEPNIDREYHSAKIESVLDNLHCGLRGDQTEKLARQMYERGVRFYG